MHSTIQAASIRSGLSPHVIRIWERRYEALTPTRTGTNRRMYSEDDISRLVLLRELTEKGHRIGSIAHLSSEELDSLLKKSLTECVSLRVSFSVDSMGDEDTEHGYVVLCSEAAKNYDSDRLRRLLLRARLQFGQRALILRVICPLIAHIGESWQAGEMRPSHEHIATAVIREILMTPVPGSTVATNAPELVVSTLSGEVHELGALLVAASARDLGWRVAYLGPNLPTEEIVVCARARRVRAVAVSLVYPDQCPIIEEKLVKLRNLLPESIALVVGGRAAPGYQERLQLSNVWWGQDLDSLDRILNELSTTR
ncbi:Methanogenic corrinoid protein MtbC1 [Prosthecobacter debontii]|uniref:Methanogenic corrinoid protein MtbC1 n=1 Tax=Prosthecobacter debontii TaxID=48467 RepID=A0A1T4Y951_9BACT|nr:MerR family transcriptional regulator [Prosthecobacter debontii]SKA97795.1 Methanogenic corrinoid protein MtbC1 [Prosthecobacter debontii]